MTTKVVQVGNMTKGGDRAKVPQGNHSGNQGRNKVKRFEDPFGLPPCLYWNMDEVASWLESVGFEKYKENFRMHFIDGRKLIKVNACSLPKIGVRIFDDILAITSLVRDQLQIKPQLHDWNPYTLRRSYINPQLPQHPSGTQRRDVSYDTHVRDAEPILTARRTYCQKMGLCYSGWTMAPGWDKVLSNNPPPHCSDGGIACRLRAAALANRTKPKDKKRLPTKVSKESSAKTRSRKSTDSTVASKATGFIRSSDGKVIGEIDWNCGSVKLYTAGDKDKPQGQTAGSKVNVPTVFHGGVYLPVVFHWTQMHETTGMPQLELDKRDTCLDEI